MEDIVIRRAGPAILLAAVFLLLTPMGSEALINGVTGTSFALTAKANYIQTADAGSVYTWGYALDGGTMQYPGPTLILTEDVEVTVTLTNDLPERVSIVFPGHDITSTVGGVPGLLTSEADPGGTVSYTFTPTEPGTYMYYSGTRQELQVEMGLVGAIIVRPATYDDATNRIAYNDADSTFDHEYLFLFTEMDATIHEYMAFDRQDEIDFNSAFPVWWFINGRNAPDTMYDAGVGWLPTQPYNILPRMHPGEKLLLRIVTAGRDLHPYHPHGNNSWTIARDGRLLDTVPGNGDGNIDLAESNFTVKAVPGETLDATFEWTGYKLGWDIYGTDPDNPHSCNDGGDADLLDDVTYEYCPDHGVELPVTLPDNKELTFGGFWPGSPFLGSFASIPPGEGGLNMNSGYTYMWHSHNEKEMTNYDIFPGGMMTMLIIEPWTDMDGNPIDIP